jgi:hypothetical protein
MPAWLLPPSEALRPDCFGYSFLWRLCHSVSFVQRVNMFVRYSVCEFMTTLKQNTRSMEPTGQHFSPVSFHDIVEGNVFFCFFHGSSTQQDYTELNVCGRCGHRLAALHRLTGRNGLDITRRWQGRAFQIRKNETYFHFRVHIVWRVSVHIISVMILPTKAPRISKLPSINPNESWFFWNGTDALQTFNTLTFSKKLRNVWSFLLANSNERFKMIVSGKVAFN